MKEIIGDKFYDTSTSKEIHHDENIKSMHNNFSETLYMSKKGELFIIGWDCRNNPIDSDNFL